MIEITKFSKSGGPLTKRISLKPDGTLHSDGSACVMVGGTARRVQFDDLAALGQIIAGMASHEAIGLGALRADLPDEVQITTKDSLNGKARLPNDPIARTTDFIAYRPREPALGLIDIDTKGMPPDVQSRVTSLGGYGVALISVLPALQATGKLVRSSTSAGLYRTDTGEPLRGSDGRHVYFVVTDGTDVPRFLRVLHDRCWLGCLGWMIVSRSGQLLERSLIDYTVGSPERLVFEGEPVLVSPLAQDATSRAPRLIDGPPLDTRATCPDLTPVEKSRLDALKASERHRLSPELEKARSQYTKEYAARSGSPLEARRIVERQYAGVLLPGVILLFDDALGKVTVADVLAHPERFVGETLADPIEGEEYGRCKAKVMQRADGSLWIHSFAHGRTTYELKYDAATIETALFLCNPSEVVERLVRLLLLADLAPDEEHRLCEIACRLGGAKIRQLTARIKAARDQGKTQRAEAERQRRAAERTDPRPQMPVPPGDAPWLPQMQVLNEVLGASTAEEPPMRSIEGFVTEVRVRRVPNMHALTPDGANHGQAGDPEPPAPEQPLLDQLGEPALAELIEQHIDYIDVHDRPVHLPTIFVKHYLQRADTALPIVAAIATLPIVLPDGSILAKRGLDRECGIVFRVPQELFAILPARDQCTDDAVRQAFRFLVEEWLVDVATDSTGNCTLIAVALSLIERSMLPERPAFFITAGRRGGGKTTTLMMLATAITGVRPAAAAWSPNEEERRKSLLAYLMAGVPCIIWDNIPRGDKITCPHIERSCTTALYADRVLGVSQTATVAASIIHLFTGNNIRPSGDLASRSLIVRLEIDRPDPENRSFVHPDPVGWTEVHRTEIVKALYTVLLGNPALGSAGAVARTRFKSWWLLVGSAVENAARLCGIDLDFQTMFLAQEEDDSESASLADALRIFANKWPSGFRAADITTWINNVGAFVNDKEDGATVRAVLFPELATKKDEVNAPAVGKRLTNHADNPVRSGAQTLCLKLQPKPVGRPDIANTYIVLVS